MKLFERRASELFHVSQVPPGSIIKGWGNESYAGKSVTVESSLSVTSVLAGFTILMEDIASLPLILYRRLKRGKERAVDHPYYALLHDSPNPEHTSMVFREFIEGHLLGWGNFFGQLIWDVKGIVREIWPLRPDRMKVFREAGVRKYLYRMQDGSEKAFRQDEILHIPAFGFDGLIGYSRITLARNAIGLAMGTEEYGSKIFANDARPSVVLMSKTRLSPDAQKTLRESWNQIYQSSENAAKVGVLEEGLDLKEIGFPPEDAQFLQTRQFQVAEIARIFRIPPHMIGDVEKSTSWGTGIEQQEQGYVAHTLRPTTTRIEQQLNKDLLLADERGTLFFQHLFEDLLRGDTQARFTAYATAITNGILNPNEARDRENMNPYQGGDTYIRQLNMAPVGATPPATPPARWAPSQARSLRLESQGLATAAGSGLAADPLLRDAVERITRREIHDLGDAIKRWSETKPEKYTQWLEQFYKRDHPEFILQILKPFADAGYFTVESLTEAASEYCSMRGNNLYNADDELNIPERVSDELMGLLVAARDTPPLAPPQTGQNSRFGEGEQEGA